MAQHPEATVHAEPARIPHPSGEQTDNVWDDDHEPTRAIPRITERARGDAPVGSPLAGLRERVEALRDRYLDLDVPDLDNLVVRYGAVEQDEVVTFLETRSKQQRAGKISTGRMAVLANCDVLVRACRGIYVRDGDDLVPLLGDEAPVFGDDELAEELGTEPGRAIEAILAFYPRQGHIQQHADQVMRLSGMDTSAPGLLG